MGAAGICPAAWVPVLCMSITGSIWEGGRVDLQIKLSPVIGHLCVHLPMNLHVQLHLHMYLYTHVLSCAPGARSHGGPVLLPAQLLQALSYQGGTLCGVLLCLHAACQARCGCPQGCPRAAGGAGHSLVVLLWCLGKQRSPPARPLPLQPFQINSERKKKSSTLVVLLCDELMKSR